MKKIILVSGFWLLAVIVFAQQDAQYSQYMFNQLALNPATAGSREVLATSLLYRDQWTGIEGAPTTASLTVQLPLRKKKIGIGAEIISDKLGPKSTSAFLLDYAYRLKLGKGKLAMGLRMGIYDYVFNWDDMNYKDQNDVYNIHKRQAKITGTGDFGMYYYTRTFYCGLSMTHLNRGKIIESSLDSSARQAVHLFIPISKAYQVGNTVINPTMLIKKASNSPAEIDLGCNVLLKERLWLGLSFRSGYGVVLLSQYQINDKMKAGYAFDYGTNKIGLAGKGSHEIMIGYDINIHGTKMTMPRYL